MNKHGPYTYPTLVRLLAVAVGALAIGLMLTACAINEIDTEAPCDFREVRAGKLVVWARTSCKRDQDAPAD